MQIRRVLKIAEKFTVDHSPEIFTAIGVVGTVTTAYLTGKATIKAVSLYEEECHYRTVPLTITKKEIFRLVWPEYVPAAITGTLTITSIILANRVSAHRVAGLATAYAVLDRGFVEYKEKVVEKLGERKEKTVRDEIASERLAKDPASKHDILITGSGKVLCYESFTGRYFESDMESLKKAQNDTNYRILSDSYASLTDFYNAAGLPTTANSDEVGWNADRLLELSFSTAMSDDQRPCIVIDYSVIPIRGYYRVY